MYKDALIISIIIILSKITSLAKDFFFAIAYGKSTFTDVYFLTSNQSTLINSALTNSIFIVLIPIFSDRNKVAGLKSPVDSIVLVYAVLAVFATIFAFNLCSVASYMCMKDAIHLNKKYLEVASLSYLPIILSTILIAHGVSKGRVFAPYVVQLLSNSIMVIVIFSFPEQDGVYVLLLVGTFTWLIYLFYFYIKERFDIDPIELSAKSLIRSSSLIFSVMLYMFLDDMLSTIGSLYFKDSKQGDLTLFNYATKIGYLIPTVFSLFLTNYVYSKIIRYKVMSRPKLYSHYFVIILMGSLVFSSILAEFRYEIVGSILKKTNLGEDDVGAIADLVLIFGLFLPLRMIYEYNSRIVMAKFGLKFVLLSLAAQMVFIFVGINFSDKRLKLSEFVILFSISYIVGTVLTIYKTRSLWRFSHKLKMAMIKFMIALGFAFLSFLWALDINDGILLSLAKVILFAAVIIFSYKISFQSIFKTHKFIG
jgi:peptidoglycan biosynthesis protein MviN/MurJ (putative lipid II flippase)